jgi:phage tail-like protein
MTQEVKTIREGGSNDRQIRLGGPIAFGQLTLKRGMTANFDLWTWFTDSIANPRLRADAEVVMLAEDGRTERVRFVLGRCLPAKMKAPTLSAKDGQVAIEELQLVYETMTIKPPGKPLRELMGGEGAAGQ